MLIGNQILTGSILTEKHSSQSSDSHCQLRILNQDRVESAHNSAVKGIGYNLDFSYIAKHTWMSLAASFI